MKDKLPKLNIDKLPNPKKLIEKVENVKPSTPSFDVNWGDSLLGRFFFWLSQKFNNRDQWGGRI